MKTRLTLKHIAVAVLLAIAFVLIGVKVKGQQRHKQQPSVPQTWPCTIVGYPSLPDGEEKITLTSRDSGKTWESIGSLCVSKLVTVRFVTAYAHAQQQPAAVVIPAPFKLSLGATKEYIALEQQKAAIIKAFNDLNEKERLLMIDIPEAARSNCKVDG